MKGRNWTEDELMSLEAYLALGLTDEQIAGRVGRTANAVNIARKRHGIASRTNLTLNARSAAAMLGVSCAKTVVRWVECGWLKAKKGPRRGGNRQWVIDEVNLLAFMEDPRGWPAWRPERIGDQLLREWATEIRKERYLRVGEVAERFCVGAGTVQSWIQRGELPAHRYGNWWIPERALDGFVPPFERSKVGLKKRLYAPDEDARICELRDKHRWSWPAIAADLGRSVGSVHGRFARISA